MYWTAPDGDTSPITKTSPEPPLLAPPLRLLRGMTRARASSTPLSRLCRLAAPGPCAPPGPLSGVQRRRPLRRGAGGQPQARGARRSLGAAVSSSARRTQRSPSRCGTRRMGPPGPAATASRGTPKDVDVGARGPDESNPGSRRGRVGQSCYVIGKQGIQGQTITHGVVSGLNRRIAAANGAVIRRAIQARPARHNSAACAPVARTRCDNGSGDLRASAHVPDANGPGHVARAD